MVVKYVDFLAFSGIPMTVTAVVSAGFGVLGFADWSFVFVVLLALVLLASFLLLRPSQASLSIGSNLTSSDLRKEASL